MTEFSLKQAAEIIAPLVGEDATALHTTLRGWANANVIRPKQSGEHTAPLKFDRNGLFGLAVVLSARKVFPLPAKAIASLFSWSRFEPKSEPIPSGGQLSYSLEGAIKGVNAGHRWVATVQPYQSVKDFLAGRVDPDSYSLIFSPKHSATEESPDSPVLIVPVNALFEKLAKAIEKSN